MTTLHAVHVRVCHTLRRLPGPPLPRALSSPAPPPPQSAIKDLLLKRGKGETLEVGGWSWRWVGVEKGRRMGFGGGMGPTRLHAASKQHRTHGAPGTPPLRNPLPLPPPATAAARGRAADRPPTAQPPTAGPEPDPLCRPAGARALAQRQRGRGARPARRRPLQHQVAGRGRAGG